MVARESRARQGWLMKHLLLCLLLCGCECWNTEATHSWLYKQLHPVDGVYSPEFSVLLGDSKRSCPGWIVDGMLEGDTRWCDYTKGRFCPVVSVTFEQDASVTCKYDEGERRGESVGTHIYFRPRDIDPDEIWWVATHELGHIYQWYGEVEFVGANSHGHVQGTVMGTGKGSTSDMPEIIYDP